MRIICSLCKKEIKERERISINNRRLGIMKVIENMHLDCYNGMRAKAQLSDN